MKNKFIAITCLLLSTSLISCGAPEKGDMGPQGEQGIQGPAGIDGKPGQDGISITKIEKTSTDKTGLIDTYTITYSNGNKSTFIVTNGKDGEAGIQGLKGEDGHTPEVKIGDNGNWFIDGVDSNVSAKGQNGDPGKSAYEIYKEYFPDYKGTEEEWLKDLINGNLGTKKKHKVTFDTGCDLIVEPQYVEHGEKASKPIDLSRPYFTFDGWYLDDEKWSFIGYSVTEDITLKAKWGIKEKIDFYLADPMDSNWLLGKDSSTRHLNLANDKGYNTLDLVKAGVIKVYSTNENVVSINDLDLTAKGRGTCTVGFICGDTVTPLINLNVQVIESVNNIKINYGQEVIDNIQNKSLIALRARVLARRNSNLLLYDGSNYIQAYDETGLIDNLLVNHQYVIYGTTLSQHKAQIQFSSPFKFVEEPLTIELPKYTNLTPYMIDDFEQYRNREVKTINDFYEPIAIQVRNAELINIYDAGNNHYSYTFKFQNKQILCYGPSESNWSKLALGDIVSFTGYMINFNNYTSLINVFCDSEITFNTLGINRTFNITVPFGVKADKTNNLKIGEVVTLTTTTNNDIYYNGQKLIPEADGVTYKFQVQPINEIKIQPRV